MEPVTHLLTGAVLARTGFNRKAAYATLAMTLAAEAPDLDVLWGFKGPVAALEHHRGWTHALIGLPFEAAIVVGAIWLVHRWRRSSKSETKAPVRWGLLYSFSLIALLSHLLLDWTNNYGLRPFFPFDPRWFAGSFVFLFEPVMFLLLLMALLAPPLFGLVSSEVGARRQPFGGRGWAFTALAGIVLLWGLRAYERQQAMALAKSFDYGAPVMRVWADPYPVNPFRWQTIAETATTYHIAAVDTLSGNVTSSSQADVFYKPPTTLATLVAKRSWLGQVYLDWSKPFTLVTDTGVNADGLTVVTFRNLRFVNDTPLIAGSERTPLTGSVYINEDRRLDHMEMDGHVQH
ncbi:metal-dependent hydrolase [Edaphobacter bradus]|uniref:metal-dependent hydrolase n=1 Tax=Edaphobacter bradus TaxID=2259016 RepID=UPI0021E006E2|nr:metal-dependent hydrolase [Edaphobacter bradus]